MKNDNTPLFLRMADDIEDRRFKRLYQLYFNYFGLTFYAVYGASLLLPRFVFDINSASNIMSFIPKFSVEIANFQNYPAQDIRYYISFSFMLYVITIVAVLFSAVANIKIGLGYPFSFAQSREVRFRHFILPLFVAITFLFFIPLPVWMDGRRGELLRNPLYMPLINAALLGLVTMTCAAATLCIGRARARKKRNNAD